MKLFRKNKADESNSVPLQGIGVIELTVPRGYSEMTENQLRYVAALQVSGQTEESIRTKCFIRFAGIKPVAHLGETYYFIRPKFKGTFSLKAEEVAYFSKKMDWITKNYIGITPIQKIGRYQAVDRIFRDITFAQYLDSENYYQAFIFTKKEQYLHKLMATLYLTGKKYDNSLTDKRAKYFTRHASEVEKIATIMWIMGVKEYFSIKFNHLFSGTSAGVGGDEKAPDMFEIINNQVRALTDGDITKREKVLQSNTWDALKELNEKAKEAKNLTKK